MKLWASVFAISAMMATSIATAYAEEVKISVNGSNTIITGDLISSDDEFFVVKTQFGEFQIARETAVCEGPGCPQEEGGFDGDLMIAGSDTIGAELMPLLVEGYANSISGGVAARLDLGDDNIGMVVRDDYGDGDVLFQSIVQSKGSSTGITGLLNNQTLIAMASRPAKGKEIRELADQNRGNLTSVDQEYIVAVDSILVIVSPENPLGELTMVQLSEIFAGRVLNWSEVGGPDLPITVYSRGSESGTFGVFEKTVLRSQNLALSPSAVIVGSNDEMSDSVTGDAGAIGFVGFASVRGAKPVDLIQSCGIRMEATEFGAKTEEYVLERRLRLFKDDRSLPEHAQGIMDYAVSSAADEIVSKAGFINLGVKVSEADIDSQRLLDAAIAANDPFALQLLREMLIDLNGAKRMSTTFRFALGARAIDNKALRDVDRVVEFLQRPENLGREVVAIGYTDSDGAFGANVRLSKGRAETVISILRRALEDRGADDVRMRATGYGELSPVSCNDNGEGRRRNRRVELWIK